MNEQVNEVRLWFLTNGIKTKDVAEAVGYSVPNMSNYLTGKRQCSKPLAERLSNLYGFSVPFLLYGQGTLFPPKPVDQSHNEGAIVNGDNKGAINITAANAALQAENARLRDEVAWLRSELAKKS